MTSEVTTLDTYPLEGQTVRVVELTTLDSATQHITSCGHGVLYASRSDGTLYVNLTKGVGPWQQVTAGTPGTRIACDRSHLYSLSSGVLRHAYLGLDGQLKVVNGATWSTTVDGVALSAPAGTEEIQGGLGNIYAVAPNTSQPGTYKLYSSQLWNPTQPTVQGSAASWILLADNLGTRRVTGAGSRITRIGVVQDGLTYRERNRAFGVAPNNTLYYNSFMLRNINAWTQFGNAGLSIRSLTADGPDDLYVLALGASGVGKRLVRFTFEESDCRDHLDNDADGEPDAEDEQCRRSLAEEFCGTHTGDFCFARIESGYPDARVSCSNGRTREITYGVCTLSSVAGEDVLAPTRANRAGVGMAQYCNVHNADGTWAFSWTGSDPCATLQAQHPGSTIVRAGLYSTTGENSIAIKCDNGGVVLAGIGTAPLSDANRGVGHTANHCVVTVSPRYMRVFQSPMVTGAYSGWFTRGYSVGHVFDHLPSCVAGDPACGCTFDTCAMHAAQWGNGENFFTNAIDTTGHSIGNPGLAQSAYDFSLDEGTPLKALGYGKVIASRDRNITPFASEESAMGTPYQSEVYIQYDVGSESSPTYRESFVAYYAHLQVRSVVTGQTVEPGQLIGYSGTTGWSTAPHVHFGMWRLSNTNGNCTKPAGCDPYAASPVTGHQFGYRVTFETITNGVTPAADTISMIDPFGWRAPAGIDPMGYLLFKSATTADGIVGMGAWSPALFIDEPPYPGL